MTSIWVDPEGKVIDSGKSHFTFMKERGYGSRHIFDKLRPLGWIQVSVHADSIDFIGTEESIKKNSQVLRNIVDNKLFNGVQQSFFVNINLVDEKGNPILSNLFFKMPDHDAKLRRFL